MYRVKLASGDESEFNSFEELSFSIVSGIVGPDAEIFHARAEKWLPIKVHPDYKRATGSIPLPQAPANGHHPPAPPEDEKDDPPPEDSDGIDLMTLLDLEELSAFDPGNVQESAPAQDAAESSTEARNGASVDADSPEDSDIIALGDPGADGVPEEADVEQEDSSGDEPDDSVVVEDESDGMDADEVPEFEEPAAVEMVEDDAVAMDAATEDEESELTPDASEGEVIGVVKQTELEADVEAADEDPDALLDTVELVDEVPGDVEALEQTDPADDDLDEDTEEEVAALGTIEQEAAEANKDQDADGDIEEAEEPVKDYIQAEWDSGEVDGRQEDDGEDEDAEKLEIETSQVVMDGDPEEREDDEDEVAAMAASSDPKDDVLEVDATEDDAIAVEDADLGNDAVTVENVVPAVAGLTGATFEKAVDEHLKVAADPIASFEPEALSPPNWGNKPTLRPTKRSRKLPLVPIAIAAGVILMAALGWMLMGPSDAEAPPEQVPTATASTTPTIDPTSVAAPGQEDSTPELNQQSLAAEDPTVTPAQDRAEYEEAYAAASTRLDASLGRAGFARLFAASRFASEEEMTRARASIAGAGVALRAYGTQEGEIEDAHPDADPSLRESRVNRELSEDLLSVSDKIYGVLLANWGVVNVRNGAVTIKDGRAESEYVRLVDELDRLMTLASNVPAEDRPVSVSRVMGAIGTTRPLPPPTLAPAPPVPDL